MKTLFFDTETTGVPKDYKAQMSNVENWPRLVQLGYIVFDEYENVIEKEYIVKPDGFSIPDNASRIHGVTTEKALEVGVDISTVLKEFSFIASCCDQIVGHNISFDINIVGAEYWRIYSKSPFEDQKVICTMKSGTEFCQIPGPYGYKWPKLSELYQHLFDEDMGAAHTALQDISNTAKCYFAMVKRDLIAT
jgi:DNA polymerase-3 subunit epsilon